MDVTKIRKLYPEFLQLLKNEGYRKRTIDNYRLIINRMIIAVESSPEISSFEAYYDLLTTRLARSYLSQIRSCLGAFKYYVENGGLYKLNSSSSGFLLQSKASYNKLSYYYKNLVDYAVSQYRTKKTFSDNAISRLKSESSIFCLHFQNKGFSSLEEIKDQKNIFDYFYDGTHESRDPSHRRHIMHFLEACHEICPACDFIIAVLPSVPRRKKNYDYLKQEERDKIEKTLLYNDGLTLREKAIGILAYYTGLRTSDIAALKLDDIDLENDRITIAAQQKTGTPLMLILRPLVKDAICEYVEKERPASESDNLFLTVRAPYKRPTSNGLWNVANNIMSAAGIRKSGGRRGLHLFRHAFASDLISKDVSRYTVSALMGHTSYSSLNSYLDADIEHLRKCSLDISNIHTGNVSKAVIMPYVSKAAEILMDVTKKLIANKLYNAILHQTLISIDNFCDKSSQSISQDLLDQWAFPFEDESNKSYCKRIKNVGVINNVIADFGLCIKEHEPPKVLKKTKLPSVLSPRCNNLLYNYVAYRKASQHWNTAYDYNLRCFDMFCSENYPESEDLTQLMIDRWCEQKENENVSSCGKRIAFMSSLCKYAYMVTHGHIDLKAPSISTRNISLTEPHTFSANEIGNFFIACDHIPCSRNDKVSLLRMLNVPAIFRLMFSSGLRTKEACKLNCEDVDLENGVINICRTKGLNEHRIAIHPSLAQYLKTFNNNIGQIIPNRKVFFPNAAGDYYSTSWLDINFTQMWYLYNREHAIPYDLRHHYALSNINSWPAASEVFNKNLLYLSKSMGHANIESTMYYYHFTPSMARHIINAKNVTFNNILNRKI